MAKAVKARPRNRKLRVCGTDAAGESTSKTLNAHGVQHFRAMEEKEKADRHLAMDDTMREAYERLRNQLPSTENDEFEWEDVADSGVDLANLLDGNIPIDLSHQGGEFYAAVRDELRPTRYV